MSIPAIRTLAVTAGHVNVSFQDGRQTLVSLRYLPRLQGAGLAALRSYQLVAGGLGVYWPELDVEMSVWDFFVSNLPLDLPTTTELEQALAQTAGGDASEATRLVLSFQARISMMQYQIEQQHELIETLIASQQSSEAATSARTRYSEVAQKVKAFAR